MINKQQFEKFNTRLLDHLTTAVVVLDRDFCLYHLNPAAEELLDTSDRHSHSVPITDLIRNSEDLVQSMNAVLHSGNSIIVRKAELHLANSGKLLVDYAISKVEELGYPFFLLELQEINRSWNISRKEALMSTHETTVEMIRGLSHEIKNPLGGIRGAAQLLAAELPDSQLQDYTNVIIGETDRLVNLVDRLTGAYKKPNLSQLNIHEVVERVRSLVEAETMGSIDIIRDYDPSLPELRGDMEQLIQAVLNIVRNAMQALYENPDPSRKPQIILRTRAVSHATIGPTNHRLVLKLEIIDNGPGISDEIIENIFYPLISGRAEGTGLGLSIAQNIIKNHNGLIECESRPGYTNFTISIPFNLEEGNAK
jgi:two-component system, NtrC family, nitrogen regulation sensor histidine kinase GlnL